MNNLKKGLFVFAALTIVIGSIGFIAPVKAVTIASGDLVKVADSSAVYLIQGAKKRVFPHNNVYLSWGYPVDFSSVKTVSASELAAYADDNAVPFRDGSLFRGTAASLHGKEASCVFAVSDAILRPVQSAEIYQALYNDADFSLVTWVPDDLLTKFNYTIGATVESSSVHLNGDLVKYEGESQVYLVVNGEKRAISSVAIEANRLQNHNVISIAASESYGSGSSITGAESAITAPGWQSSEVVVEAGSLSVSLAADTPSAATVPYKATNVPVLKFNLANSGASDITISSMIFKRTGIGAYDDYEGLYVYDGNIKLTNSRTISSDTNLLEFSTFIQDLVVSAGSSKAIILRGDVDNAAGTNASNQDAFKLQSVVSDASAVVGLPITGSLITLGSQSVSSVAVTSAVAPSNPTVGAKDAILGEFKIDAGDNAIDVNQIIINLTGTIDSSDLSNMKLVYLGETLATSSAIIKDEITFTLSSPFRIPKSVIRTLQLRGDVAGRIARTIQLYLDEDSDLDVTDVEYGYGAYISGNTFTGDSLVLQGGEINLTDQGPVSGNVPNDTNDVSLLDFDITPNRNIEVKRMQVRIQIKGTAGTEDLAVNELFDLRIKDRDTGATIAGPFDYQPAAITDVSTTYGNGVDATYNSSAVAVQLINDKTWTDTFTIAAGVTKHLSVTTDIHSGADAGILIKAEVIMPANSTDSYVKDTDTNDYIVIADVVPTSLNGEAMTITATDITVTKASLPETNDTIIKSANDVPALGMVLTASNAGDMTVRQIVGRVMVNADATPAVAGSGDTDARTVIASASLYDGSTLLKTAGVVYSSVAYSTVTFDSLDVVVPAGSNKSLVIKVDVKAVASTSYFGVTVIPSSGISSYDANGSSDPDDADINQFATGNLFTVNTAGNLTMAAESDPRSDIVIAGSSNVLFSKIKFRAQYEAFNINKLRVNNVLGSRYGDNEISKVHLSYPKEDGSTGTVSGDLSSYYVNFDLSLAPMYVAKDSYAILEVRADVNTVAAGANSGHQPQLGVDYNATDNTEAIGVSSGTKKITLHASADANGQLMVVRKSKPTVENIGLPALTLADSGDIVLSKFKISADANEAVALKKLSFNLTLSDNATSSALYVDTLKLYDASNMSTALTVEMIDDAATDVSGTATSIANGSNTVYVGFGTASATEEVISAGSSKTFVLKGRIRNSAQYDSIMTKLIIDNDSSVIYQGYASDHATELVDLTGYTDGSVVSNQVADFIWSDNADGYDHAYALDTATLLDWTDGYLVKTLPSNYQTLTR